MTNFQRVSGRLGGLGAQTSLKPQVGRIAVPQRVVALSPTVEHTALTAGDQYLALPQWTKEGGPMAFRIAADDSGSVLVGMGQAVSIDIVEYGLVGALILILCTSGILSTSIDDESAPASSRFSAAVNIPAGTAQMFVGSSIDGEVKWCPVASGSGASATVERIAFGSGGGALDASTGVSFVSYNGLVPEAPITVNVTLPDGTVDGQSKVACFAASANITWKLTPDNFADGTDVAAVTSASGATTLVWDGTEATWRLTVNGMTLE